MGGLGEHRAAGQVLGGVLRHPELTAGQRAPVEHVETASKHVDGVTFGHRSIVPPSSCAPGDQRAIAQVLIMLNPDKLGGLGEPRVITR